MIQKAIDEEPETKERDIRMRIMGQLHQCMDLQLENRMDRILLAVERKDTTTLWRLITASAEAAFITTLAIEGSAAKAMRGRGIVTIRD
jgi:hypothetical protein